MFDPVCGMELASVKEGLTLNLRERVFVFCGPSCRERFQNDPARFQKKPLVRLHNVGKIFQSGRTKTEVLRRVCLNIWEGDFTVVIGASGSGKSTLLNMIGLLDRPTSGQVLFEGRDAALLDDEARANLRSRTFGFVFQQYHLIPWLSARENVALPLLFAGRTEAEGEIAENFAALELNARMHHRPFELSGGEQQRVALLRALAVGPRLILGDEPTGNLDSATGRKLLNLLLELNKERGKTLVVVTHDADIAQQADQLIALKDGRIIVDHQKQRKIYTE